MPPMAPTFETLDEMREALEEAPIAIYFVERLEPERDEDKLIAGLLSVSDEIPAEESLRRAFGGGKYKVYVALPETPVGHWAGVCTIEITGSPTVLPPSIVLPPGMPMDILMHPAAALVIRNMFLVDRGEPAVYEEVPPEAPAPPDLEPPEQPAEAPRECPPRGPLAAGMALGAGMTAYGAGAFLSDMMQMLGGVGQGMDRGLSALAPLFAHFAQSAMAPPYAAVHPGMAVPPNMPPMPDMPDMPTGAPEPPSEGASSPPVDDASEAPGEQETQGAPQGEPEEPPAEPEPPESVS